MPKRFFLASVAILLPFLCAAMARADSDVGTSSQNSLDLERQIQSLEQRIAILEQNQQKIPPVLQTSAQASTAPASVVPLSFADFTWLNGNSREKSSPFNLDYFTPEILVDANYVEDFNNPSDHTLDGSCETGRADEVQIQQLGVGGDLNVDNVRARVMTQFGMYSTMTPRDDSSPSRGQWDMADAYRYLSEANGGYHFDVGNGVNVDAGIFMSYVGLFSYYNSENWAYQPSYVSANTPWFFNGLRIQTFPTDRWKAEFWIINSWQSYGMFNQNPGLGTQQLWRPTGNIELLSNDYWGYDSAGLQAQQRYHTDNSIEIKYYDAPHNTLDKAAFSFTFDAGGESGDGATVGGGGITFDYMPNQYLTWRAEYDHRASNVPYFVGAGGITPPGGNTGLPGSAVAGWAPDLVHSEDRINLALLIHI